MLRLHELVSLIKVKTQNIWNATRNFDYKQIFSAKVLTLAIVLVMLPITLLVAKTQQILQQNAAPSLATQVQQAKTDLLTKYSQYLSASAQTKDQALNNLITSSVLRKQLLEKAMQSNPQLVISNAISTSQRNQLPPFVQANVEQQVNQQGVLSILHEDGRNIQSEEKDSYVLTSGSKLYALFGNTSASKYVSRTITVNGVALDSAIVAKTIQPLNNRSIQEKTSGEFRVAVILFNFAKNSAEPVSRNFIQSMIFGNIDPSVNRYMQEVSYNHITKVTGDIYGWYTIANPNDDCSRNNLTSWTNAANEAFTEDVTSSHPSLGSYDRIIYVLPYTSSCVWDGTSTIPGANIWINFRDYSKDNLQNTQFFFDAIHELGHDFGMEHSSGSFCVNNLGIKVPTAISLYLCHLGWEEYANMYDIMGGGIWAAGFEPITTQYNAFSKYQLGWLNDSNIQDVDINKDLTYQLSPLESIPNSSIKTNIKALRISKKDDTYKDAAYFIEYRQSIGYYDSEWSSNNAVFSGVLIGLTLAKSKGNIWQEYLIDTTPGSKQDANYPYADWLDAPLLPGNTFYEPSLKLAITVSSPTIGGITVHVKTHVTPPGKMYGTTCQDFSGECVNVLKSKALCPKNTKEVDSFTCNTSYDAICCLPQAVTPTPTPMPHYTCLDNPGGKCVDENYYVKYQCGSGYQAQESGGVTCGQDASGANRICCVPKVQSTSPAVSVSCPSYDTRNADGTCHDPCSDAACGEGAYCYNAGQAYTANHAQGCKGFIGQDGYLYSCVKGQDGKLYTDPNPQVTGRCQSNSCTINPSGSDSCTTGFVTGSGGGSTSKLR